MAQQSSSVSQAFEWWLKNKATNKIWYYPISRKDERNFLAISKRKRVTENFFEKNSCIPKAGFFGTQSQQLNFKSKFAH